MAKMLKNAPEVVATEVVANEVVNTSKRPRPAIILDSEKVYFQNLEGSKYETLTYRKDGKDRVIKCSEVKDNDLKGFKVGPYIYDIPQHGVSLKLTATYFEVAEDGQRFSGSKTFFDGEVKTSDGKVKPFERLTGDKIREDYLGIEVDGSERTPVGMLQTLLNGKGAKYASKIHNKTFQEKWKAVIEDLETLAKAEAEARAKAKDEARAKAKAKAKDERDAKNVTSVSDDILARELARRTGISLEDARKMFGA